MKNLYLDIAAYSDKPVEKHGIYASAESDHSRVLLMGYAFDDENPHVLNLMRGDRIPHELLSALTNPGINKFAYNARFVRVFLSQHLFCEGNTFLPPLSWRCLKSWAEYLGYPKTFRSVAEMLNVRDSCPNLRRVTSQAVASILDNAYDVQSSTVRDAILPKLSVLSECVKHSVQMIRQLHRRLTEMPMPEHEWLSYWTAEYANDRGILLDTKFLLGAHQCAEFCNKYLWDRFCALTGLHAGCSMKTFKGWLLAHGVNAPSLSQEAIAKLRRHANEETAEALTLWGNIMCNPIRRYKALVNHCSADGRLRGLYLSNGGRLGEFRFPYLQTDSLSICSESCADEQRKRIAACDKDWLKANIACIPKVLTVLLGTVFIPDPGKRFAMFYFPKLNQRVLHWLARANLRDCAACTDSEDFQPEAPLVEEFFPMRDYSNADPAICRLNLDVDNAVRSCLTTRCTEKAGALRFHADQKRLAVTLPSERVLVYHKPFIRIDPAGYSVIHTMGLNSDDKWSYRILSGKDFVQDIVRAIARDILLYKMELAEANDVSVPLPFRNGLLMEIDADQNLCAAAHMFRSLPAWAKNLPVDIDGYLCEGYFKRTEQPGKKGGACHAR